MCQVHDVLLVIVGHVELEVVSMALLKFDCIAYLLQSSFDVEQLKYKLL